MEDNKVKKRISMLLMCAILLSLVAFPASAANTTDVAYYKSSISSGTWISTTGNYKENASYVYVLPNSAPNGYSRIKTFCNVSSIGTNKTGNPSKGSASSSYVSLKSGRAYAVTQMVYEHGDYTSGYGVRMWLSMTPDSGSGSMSGVWSPDYTSQSGTTYV